MDVMMLLKVVLAVLLPPVGVLVHEGLTVHFVLNIVLTFLGWLPGVIHAFYCLIAHEAVDWSSEANQPHDPTPPVPPATK